MSEWWLVGILVLITVVASVVMVYPLRRNLKVSLPVIPIIFALISTGYFFWGGFAEWQKYIHHQSSQVLAQQILKSVKNPQELIDKLKAKLDERPKSAKGWYLLGRLYTSQNDDHNASKAFAKAYRLKPLDEQIAVNYAHSLWQINSQQFTPEIIEIFDALLKNNPKQPDALAMLAMNAFLSHAYEDAIDYWQRLLSLAPEQSEEALAIRKAIAKAQEHINLGREQNE
jgi:cytochrome c-type biogenesis protein CcmH